MKSKIFTLDIHCITVNGYWLNTDCFRTSHQYIDTYCSFIFLSLELHAFISLVLCCCHANVLHWYLINSRVSNQIFYHLPVYCAWDQLLLCLHSFWFPINMIYHRYARVCLCGNAGFGGRWWWWRSSSGNRSSQLCEADWYMWNRSNGHRCEWLIVIFCNKHFVHAILVWWYLYCCPGLITGKQEIFSAVSYWFWGSSCEPSCWWR